MTDTRREYGTIYGKNLLLFYQSHEHLATLHFHWPFTVVIALLGHRYTDTTPSAQQYCTSHVREAVMERGQA